MNHTPGPWFVFPRNPEMKMLHVGPSWHSVAWVIAIDDEPANANLIAAAPDLLAACEKLRAAWERTNIKADFADQMVIGERFAAIDAAIAKARGES